VLQHHQTASGQHSCRCVEHRRHGHDVVRWIQQDQIERARAQTRHDGGGVAPVDSIALLHAAGREVLFDQRDRAAVLLNEGHVRGAAADRLDAHRARAGEAVQHARPVDSWCQDVEEGFA
jgi:hypothetical protein